MSTATQYNKERDATLQFLYDVKSQKVIYATQSPDVFFETPVDFSDASPFQSIAQANDTAVLQQHWDDCLLLKSQEKSFFNITAAIPHASFSNYHFNITALDSVGMASGSLLLFFVQKTLDASTESLLEEAYRKECAEFIDIAAHELDAPVRKALVLVDRLGNKAGADIISMDYFVRLQSCLTEMRQLVNALTTLSKCSSAKSGQLPCDTALIVKQVIQDMPALQENDVLSIGSLPVVSGDADQLQLLFRNLLENAVRFGPKDGQLRINLTAETVDPAEFKGRIKADKHYYKFIVSDNGIGFDQQFALQIFKPFMRLHGKSDYPGNGIGLALCNRVVENHQGIIYGEGEERKGARFIFILPESLN